jgi:hypothetical protein
MRTSLTAVSRDGAVLDLLRGVDHGADRAGTAEPQALPPGSAADGDGQRFWPSDGFPSYENLRPGTPMRVWRSSPTGRTVVLEARSGAQVHLGLPAAPAVVLAAVVVRLFGPALVLVRRNRVPLPAAAPGMGA